MRYINRLFTYLLTKCIAYDVRHSRDKAISYSEKTKGIKNCSVLATTLDRISTKCFLILPAAASFDASSKPSFAAPFAPFFFLNIKHALVEHNNLSISLS